MKLTKAEAKFIDAAVSKDITRAALTSPHVTAIDGTKWLCATDGHRLHMVRVEDAAEGYVVVAKDGTVGAAALEMKYPDVAQVIPTDLAHQGEVETDVLVAISAGKSDLVRVAFDPAQASFPKPQVTRYAVPKGAVAVNTRYSADACIIATDRKQGTATVRVRFGGPLTPVVYEDPTDAPRWRAVIMPVRLS